MSVLDRRHIHIETRDTVPVEFERALTEFLRDDALTNVQREYMRLLPEGEVPEFTIRELAGKAYCYTNKHGRTSRVWEIAKAAREAGAFDVVYYARGERFFGWFRAVIHLSAARTPGGEVTYRLDVYAQPESALQRFVVTRLGLVTAYFQSKTEVVADLAEQICTGLCTRAAAGSEPTRQEARPSLRHTPPARLTRAGATSRIAPSSDARAVPAAVGVLGP